MSVRSRILGQPAPKMPSGLVELMDGLARDVLKNNPDNIYEFCARHMQTLLEIRDGRALKPFITLEQRIEKAQKIVKQRAEQRQQAYDKEISDKINEQVLSTANTPPCGDDSKYSDKKDIENVFTDVQSEEKGEISKVVETQMLEKTTGTVLTDEVKNKINNEIDVLDNIDHENIEENNEILIVNKGADKSEPSNLLTENELETDDVIKSNGSNSIENNPLKENEIAAIRETNIENVTESILDDGPIQLENNDIVEDKVILSEDNGNHLNTESTKIVQNDDGTDLQNEVKASIENINDEIKSTDTIEKVVLPSENVSQHDSNFTPDMDRFEKQIDNSLQDNQADTASNNETNDNLIEKQAEDLSAPEKSRDHEILTVILSSNSAESSLQNSEPSIVQSNESEAVQIIVPESIPNEVDKIPEQNLDTEHVPESTNDNDSDKTNNMNSSMDLETAAITIQKVFRSFLFKTKTASYDDSTTVDINLLTEDKEKEENEVINIKDRRALGISRMDTVLQTVNEEKSLSLSTDDSSTLSSAATIIQAHVRGFLVRNKLNLNKTISSNSFIDSDAPSIPSLEADSDAIKSKTVLNIHIVPEGGHFVSRDESILTSMDLSLDSSPPSSVNLHPLGYDKSERRKQLKREDAIQSVSPPSNNSGKLSEDHDSVKEILVIENNGEMGQAISSEEIADKVPDDLGKEEAKVVIGNDSNIENQPSDAASDEMDVVTPFVGDKSSRESDNSTKLLHSGEFHDIVVPTNVTRSDTSVVREFQNVLVYFILWNN